MADIDFEELDKAVNSLMNQHNSAKEAPEEDSDKQESINTATQGSNVPEPRVDLSETPSGSSGVDPLSSDLSPAGSNSSMGVEPTDSAAQSSKSPLLTRRQSGRFMDVVHPSSDMKTSSTRQEVSSNRVKSRVSSSLQPIGNAGTQEEVKESQVDTTTTYDKESVPDISSGNLSGIGSDEVESLTPMESPFLTDIEVDKRPLGGPTGANSVIEGGESLKNDDVIKELDRDTLPEGMDPSIIEQSLAGDPWSGVKEQQDVAIENTTPLELSSEVLALESMEVTDTAIGEGVTKEFPLDSEFSPSPSSSTDLGSGFDDASEHADTADSVQDEAAGVVEDSATASVMSGSDEPSESKDTASTDETLVESSEAPAGPPKESRPLDVGDISRQYKPSDTGAPEPSDIFAAASEAPQQLVHVDKKKSRWNIVVWLVVSLLVGVIGGVLLWYFLVK